MSGIATEIVVAKVDGAGNVVLTERVAALTEAPTNRNVKTLVHHVATTDAGGNGLGRPKQRLDGSLGNSMFGDNGYLGGTFTHRLTSRSLQDIQSPKEGLRATQLPLNSLRKWRDLDSLAQPHSHPLWVTSIPMKEIGVESSRTRSP